MRRLYTFFLSLLLPLIIARLYWKARRLPQYRARILERFFLQKIKPTPVDIWLHAVSLGEVIAATPLIEALLQQKRTLLVTTMTPTGSMQVQKKFGARVMHQYLPYDLPWIYRRFFAAIRPRTGIIMETELWPNLMYQAQLSNVPIILINARISNASFKKYMYARFFFCKVLSMFQVILTQSARDTQRFLALGASEVHNIGNLKFDVTPCAGDNSGILEIRARCGVQRAVIVAASTHAPEEQMLLVVLPRLQAILPAVLFIIAPRHPERFADVRILSQNMGFITGLRSELEQLNHETEVVIMDSLGELMSVYRASDYAFVGGSLIAIGGHNVLEPIAMQVPVCCGEFMQNSAEICDELTQANGLQQLKTADEFVDFVSMMVRHNDRRLIQIAAASKILKLHQGAVGRALHWIRID